jgi:hypothetical protein
MRVLSSAALVAGLWLAAVGCGPRKNFDGPTVDAFTGKLVQNGKPVTLPADEEVTLRVFHEKGQSFGIRIKTDGSFQIGWMPIGKYSAILERQDSKRKGPPKKYSVPGGLTIEEGKTEYQIVLGKGWNPSP